MKRDQVVNQILKQINGGQSPVVGFGDSDFARVAKETNCRIPWKFLEQYKIGGVYDFSSLDKCSSANITPDVPAAPKVTPTKNDVVSPNFYIPTKDPNFVLFGDMKIVDEIIRSKMFLPTFIYGDTGLAKSSSVIEICARKKRELIRLNVNAMTDESDMIGHFSLVDGNTVFDKGPLIQAMERGAILLIDEITALNPANAFLLFTALEGKEVYIKKTNEKIIPAPGFNIIATDNTVGRGSADGRFAGTNIQNDAFLDRFLVGVKYDYPTASMEKKILQNVAPDMPETTIKSIVRWANIIRQSFNDGIVDENISVRRLVSIVRVYSLFGDMKTSINLVLNRMESDTKNSFMEFFEKIVEDPEFGNVDFESTESSLDE